LNGEEDRICDEDGEDDGEDEEPLRSFRVSSPKLGGASEPEVVLRGEEVVAANRSLIRNREALGLSGVAGCAVVVVVVCVAEVGLLSLARCLSARPRWGVANLIGGLLTGGVVG
jgi:hypothetical protein